MTEPLTVLNERELDVLRLLAGGHTAKSIAQRTGLSVNAVNDRLRDARRKTGVGSSRELARLIASRENWAEKIGVSSGASVDQAELPDAKPPAATQFHWKAIVMVSIITSALALVLWQGHPAATDPAAPAAKTTVDPALQMFDPGDRDPRTLNAALASERRDPAWADRMEAMLSKAYTSALANTALSGKLHVRCGRTLCEVYAVDHTPATQADEAALKQAVSESAFPALEEAGLVNRGLTTSRSDGTDGRLAFVTYWQGPPRP